MLCKQPVQPPPCMGFDFRCVKRTCTTGLCCTACMPGSSPAIGCRCMDAIYKAAHTCQASQDTWSTAGAWHNGLNRRYKIKHRGVCQAKNSFQWSSFFMCMCLYKQIQCSRGYVWQGACETFACGFFWVGFEHASIGSLLLGLAGLNQAPGLLQLCTYARIRGRGFDRLLQICQRRLVCLCARSGLLSSQLAGSP